MCHIPCSTWGPTTHTAIQLQPHTKHLSQLLITLAWIIISINNNRVLQVGLCWNGAHIIPYFKFQLSPSAERAALPSLPPPLPICNPLSLSLSFSFSCSVRNPSTANCSAAFLHMETSMKWVGGTLLISYVSYLTFDFFKIYKHFFLWHSIGIAWAGAPERDSSAGPDENVLQKIARYCATMLPDLDHLEQCIGKSLPGPTYSECRCCC